MDGSMPGSGHAAGRRPNARCVAVPEDRSVRALRFFIARLLSSAPFEYFRFFAFLAPSVRLVPVGTGGTGWNSRSGQRFIPHADRREIENGARRVTLADPRRTGAVR